MVYRRTSSRRFMVRSRRSVNFRRMMLVFICLCTFALFCMMSVDASLKAGSEVAGKNLTPIGLSWSV